MLLLSLIPPRIFHHPHEQFWYDVILWFCWEGSCGAEGRLAFKQIEVCERRLHLKQGVIIRPIWVCITSEWMEIKHLALQATASRPHDRESVRQTGRRRGRSRDMTEMKRSTWKQCIYVEGSWECELSKDAARRNIGLDISLTLKHSLPVYQIHPYLIEFWVKGLFNHCRFVFGFLLHIWLQVSGKRKAHRRTKWGL